MLINNAAFHGGAPDDHRVGTLDAETFQTYMSVNVFGPLAVSEAFLESVQMSDQKKIVTLSSGIASLANPPPVDGFHFHAISKTAVNRAMRGLQVQLRGTGVIVALISPGGVDTDGFAAAVQAYQGGRGSGERPGGGRGRSPQFQLLTPEESAAAMAEVIDGLDGSYDGSHLNVWGDVVPW